MVCYLRYFDSHHWESISGIFVVVNLSLGIGSLYPVNMIHSYVTLVTITIVTGFPSLIAERGSSYLLTRTGTMATNSFLHILLMALVLQVSMWKSSSPYFISTKLLVTPSM